MMVQKKKYFQTQTMVTLVYTFLCPVLYFPQSLLFLYFFFPLLA